MNEQASMAPPRTMILINSLDRSGGSLLARLLDGGTKVAAYPMEVWFSRNKQEWPDLDACLSRKDFEQLCMLINCDKNFADAARQGSLKKALYDDIKFDFDYERFLRLFRELLETRTQESEWTYRAVFDCQAEAFFRTWQGDDYFEREPIRFIVSHVSQTCFLPPASFFRAYGDGFILQTIRDPRGYYSSRKNLNRLPTDEDLLAAHIRSWEDSTRIAIRNQVNFRQCYHVLRYEDLVTQPEHEMRSICEVTGIEYSDKLLTPGLDGQVWSGNSSYRSAKEGLQKHSKDAWKEHLTASEVRQIEKQVGPLMELFGYACQFEPPDVRTRVSALFADLETQPDDSTGSVKPTPSNQRQTMMQNQHLLAEYRNLKSLRAHRTPELLEELWRRSVRKLRKPVNHSKRG